IARRTFFGHFPEMPAIVTWNHCTNDLVHSIRDMFVCSPAKTFGHLSDRAKKQVIAKVLTMEHYTSNKVFVFASAARLLLASARNMKGLLSGIRVVGVATLALGGINLALSSIWQPP